MNQQAMQALIMQLRQTHNPKQLLEQLTVNNPTIQKLFDLAKKGDVNSLEQVARESFKEQGRDFDKEFSQFLSYFK